MVDNSDVADGAQSAVDERQGIQSVEIAAKILQALEAGGGPMTLSEVAAAAGYRPNKTHRYLVSLVRVGLASRTAVGSRYDLGAALRRIGAEALRRTNEIAIASDFSTELRDTSGHSVNLAAWSAAGPLIVRWDYGSYALSLQIRVGTVLPLLESAIGRVFLAHLPEPMTLQLLERSQRARAVPVSAKEIERIKRAVRSEGVAVITEGALVPAASVISAPVFTPSDTLPLVMSMVLPGERLDTNSIGEARSLLLDTVGRLSRELGAAPNAEDHT